MAKAGVPYVVNFGDSTNAHIKGATVVENLTTSNSFNTFNRIASNVVTACRFTFSGGTFSGTNSWQPAGDGTYPGMTIRDLAYAMRSAPWLFTSSDMHNFLNQIASCTNADHSIGTGISPNGTRATAVQIDHCYDFMDVAYSAFLKDGNASGFNQWSVQISNAVIYPSVSNHLVCVNGVVGWGFEDSVTTAGTNLMCSAFRYRAYNQMAIILASLGKNADANVWANELPLIATAISIEFYDLSTNMFYGMTYPANKFHSVPGSAYATMIGSLITNHRNATAQNLIDLIVSKSYQNGAVRNLLFGEYFGDVDAIPDTYQNGGYWPVYSAWCARAMRLIDSHQADLFMDRLAGRFASSLSSVTPRERENLISADVGAGQYLASATLPLSYYAAPDNSR